MSDKIYDPQFQEDSADLEAYADFVAIVRQLRRDCPWDREQTHESVRHLLIEEAYEAVDAIDRGDWSELRRELGDLLLHVVFHSVIAEQSDRFRLREVIEAETEKLIRRHPHVFGDVEVSGVDEVLSNWEQIKMEEGEKRSVLDGIPANLPALLGQAYFGCGEYLPAVQAFTEALGLRPRLGWLYLARADARRALVEEIIRRGDDPRSQATAAVEDVNQGLSCGADEEQGDEIRARLQLVLATWQSKGEAR